MLMAYHALSIYLLLVAASISELQSLFRNCEKELECLDMRINAKKHHVVRALAQDLTLLLLVLLLQRATIFLR